MNEPNFILLYVKSPLESVDFYTNLLGHGPIESSPTFAMFALASGVMLGLWARHTVEPTPSAAPGGGELAFAVGDASVVNDMFAQWSERGLAIEQKPVKMDFGFTFLARDPDGHRLRVFAPG